MHQTDVDVNRADVRRPDRRQLGTPFHAPLRVVGRLAGGWAYEMQRLRQNGRWVVSQLRVWPDSPAVEIERLFDATKFWMDMGVADWAADSARELARVARTQPAVPPPAPVPVGGLTARHLRQISFSRVGDPHVARVWRRMKNELRRHWDRNRRGLGRGDVRLARIAQRYVDALTRGSRTQNADVARQLRITNAQVRDAIHRARKQGLLSPTGKQGVPGGELTSRALEILEGAGDAAARVETRASTTTSARPPSSETANRKAQASARRQKRRASVPKARSQAPGPHGPTGAATGRRRRNRGGRIRR